MFKTWGVECRSYGAFKPKPICVRLVTDDSVFLFFLSFRGNKFKYLGHKRSYYIIMYHHNNFIILNYFLKKCKIDIKFILPLL